MRDNTSDLGLLLLLLLLAGEIKGRKRLQKIVCVLKHLYKIPFNFEFVPYHYGPYSEELADAVDTLKAANLIKENAELLPSYLIQYNYQLSPRGEKMITKIIGKSTNKIAEQMKEPLYTIHTLPTAKLVKIAKELTY